MRSALVIVALACVLLCLAQAGRGRESADPEPTIPAYKLTAAAILVDLRTDPPRTCAIVEIRNRSLERIRRVEVFPYSKELADSIVYTEVSSESIDSPEPIADVLFDPPQVIADDKTQSRRLSFKLARDLEPAEASWVLIKPGDQSAPLVTTQRTGAELSIESTRFAMDLDKLVIGLVPGAGDRLELRAVGAGYATGSTSYEGVLLSNQIASLSRLLAAAAQLSGGDPVSSWPAAAYFSSTQAGTRPTVKAIFVSTKNGLEAEDRGWILAAATLSGGAVIVAVLVALGRRSPSRKAER